MLTHSKLLTSVRQECLDGFLWRADIRHETWGQEKKEKRWKKCNKSYTMRYTDHCLPADGSPSKQQESVCCLFLTLCVTLCQSSHSILTHEPSSWPLPVLLVRKYPYLFEEWEERRGKGLSWIWMQVASLRVAVLWPQTQLITILSPVTLILILVFNGLIWEVDAIHWLNHSVRRGAEREPLFFHYFEV